FTRALLTDPCTNLQRSAYGQKPREKLRQILVEVELVAGREVLPAEREEGVFAIRTVGDEVEIRDADEFPWLQFIRDSAKDTIERTVSSTISSSVMVDPRLLNRVAMELILRKDVEKGVGSRIWGD
ncbi:hypothetical protein Tco_0016124, partial [Tanacetum coccineum]